MVHVYFVEFNRIKGLYIGMIRALYLSLTFTSTVQSKVINNNKGHSMQVTAIYQGNEIGYGEGQHYIYAIEECIDSIDLMYIYNALQDIELHLVGNTEGATLPKTVNLTDYFYREREYF